jgi:hypothetical protein
MKYLALCCVLLTACGDGANTEYVQSCNIDAPTNGAKLSTAQDFGIVGWAYDNKTKTSPEHIRIQLNSFDGQVSKTFEATRVKRPDVVKAFNTPGAEMSGYNAVVPANSLTAGQYEIVMLQDMPDRNLKCTKEMLFEVTGQVISIQQPAGKAVPIVTSTPPQMVKKANVKSPLEPVDVKKTKVKKSKKITKKQDKLITENITTK